jgi:hypothetical protein
MSTEKLRVLIDHGETRDKVAADDPAAVPMDADAEAAGTPTPAEAEEADHEKKAPRTACLKPDRARARANPKRPWRG